MITMTSPRFRRRNDNGEENEKERRHSQTARDSAIPSERLHGSFKESCSRANLEAFLPRAAMLHFAAC